MIRKRYAFFPIAIFATLLAASAAAEGDAKHGREIAVQHCSRCHVVPDYNPNGGIGSTPSFSLLARLTDGLERFDSFFDRRPHPSFVRVTGHEPPTALPVALEPVRLEPEDLEDIKAYARLLRSQAQ